MAITVKIRNGTSSPPSNADSAELLLHTDDHKLYHGNPSGAAYELVPEVSLDISPQLGNNLDMNQFNLVFDPTPTSDHSWNGKTAVFTAGENLVIGDVCYFKSDGKFWLVDADAEATTKGMLAMATTTISTDATGVFLLWGYIRDDTWVWTVGAELYCAITPGNPTATPPNGSLDIVRIIGYAYNADVIYFNPDDTYIEVA